MKFILLSLCTVTFFCDLAPCSLVDGPRFIGGTCALHHRRNFAIIIGKRGWGQTDHAYQELELVKESCQKEGEDWFDPALNMHVPLSPTVTPIFFMCPSSTQQQKKFLGGKNIAQHQPLPVKVHLCPPFSVQKCVFLSPWQQQISPKHSYPLTNLHGVIYNHTIS